MRNEPVENEIYTHFKGNSYQIVGIALNSETLEKEVVYRQLYGEGKLWVRPLEMFMSEVDHEKYPEVTQKYRFEKVEVVLENGVADFLDAETYTDKMDVLRSLRFKITDNMLDTMAMALEIELKEQTADRKYEELMQCLELHARYEGGHLRGNR